jgi:hypothetical protein
MARPLRVNRANSQPMTMDHSGDPKRLELRQTTVHEVLIYPTVGLYDSDGESCIALVVLEYFMRFYEFP